MNIYFVTRLFNGLYESIQNEKWQPTGIPTIFKLAEKIVKTHQLTWIVACKNSKDSEIIDNVAKRLKLRGIEIYCVPFKKYSCLNMLNTFINDVMVLYHTVKLSFRTKNRLFYCDRTDILTAAALKYILKAAVVVRILGIYPNQKKMVQDGYVKVFNPLTYFAYRTQFDLAICTQDGSGGEYYLKRLLNRKTPIKLLLNGVENKTRRYKNKGTGKITLIYVGKLSEEKGILELIVAAKILRKCGFEFILKIIGKGQLLPKIERLCKKWLIGDVIELVGSIPHEHVQAYYDEADIYISLNKLGNLSNTVLEAMTSGKCIIMLNKDSRTHTDEFTTLAIPEDTVIRIDRNDMVADLTQKLKALFENPHKIEEYSIKMKTFSKSFNWSWEKRIDHELDLLKRIGQGLSLPFQGHSCNIRGQAFDC